MVLYTGDVLLVATGRKPNVDGVGLEAAGIEFDHTTGVKVLCCVVLCSNDFFPSTGEQNL